MTYQWTEKRRRDGSIEYKLQCPLMRGEHRPTVFVGSDGAVTGNGTSGYIRRFADVELAKAEAAGVPMEVGGFRRLEP